MNLIPTTVSASDLQRDSANIINLALANDQPIVVIRNNKPQVAVISLKKLQSLINKASDWETKDTLAAIKAGEAEYKAGKLKPLSTDLHELLDD